MTALERIRRYVAMRAEMPLRNMDDSIHGVHTGTQWEAELRLSDVAALLDTNAALLAALRDVAETPAMCHCRWYDCEAPEIARAAIAKAEPDA